MKYRESCPRCKGTGYIERELSLDDAEITSAYMELGGVMVKNNSSLRNCALAFVVALGLSDSPDPETAIKALQTMPKSRNRDLLIDLAECKPPEKKGE